MVRSMRGRFPTWSLLLALTPLVGVSVFGQEFRVETEIFLDRASKPMIESLTLFSGEVAYDILLTPVSETTVFDIRRGKITLLDRKRQLRATLTTEQLLEFSAAIKQRGSQKVEQAAFFEPAFETTYNAEQLLVTLSSEPLTYRARGIAARSEEAAQRYRQFADWYARLNAMQPNNLPPFGRLELNKALAERGLIPQEIERTIVRERPLTDRTSVVTSKHTVNWLISGTDRKRIEEAGQQLVNFREVLPQEYWADLFPKGPAK